jgi:hypothetical protein
LVSLPLLLLAIALVNTAQGTLFHPNGLRVANQDLLILIRQAKPSKIDTYFPLLRDYPTVLLVVLTSVTLTLIYRQWAILEDLLPELQRRGVLLFDDKDSPSIIQAADETNSGIARMGGHTGTYVVVAVMLSLFLVFAQRATGIFAFLSPSNGSAELKVSWTRDAYRSWWASLDTHQFGFVAYFCLALLAIYYMLKQNEVAVRYLWFFWRLRGKISYGVNLSGGADEFHGWGIIRQLLLTIYMSIIVHAITLTALFLVIPVEEFQWVIPLLAIFMILNPLYVIVPLILLRRGACRYKEAEILRIVRLVKEEESRCQDPLQVLRLRVLGRNEVAFIRSIPNIPFRFGQLVLGAIIYVLPIVSAVVQIVTTFTGP